MKDVTRCEWANQNELLAKYHDEEWGVPAHGDQKLFEMLNLEGAQAGLSWLTVLKKRDRYREVFDEFDAKKIAVYDEDKRRDLLADPGIIRNKLKVNAFIENAKAFLKLQEEGQSFDSYIWSFSGTDAVVISEAMSKDLRKRGFRFVGPTICYAFMQAIGMVNDHEKSCFKIQT